MPAVKLNPELENYTKALNLSKIPEERRLQLDQILNYLKVTKKTSKNVQLIFICTHNSRRSQLAQVWAETAAAFFGMEVKCFSGGTEVTGFALPAVESLKRAGFTIESSGEENPVHFISFSKEAAPIKAFSKFYGNAVNPQEGFAAVMTCSEADKNCPIFPGAEKRLSLPYKDPKDFDGSPQEKAAYENCSRQIAQEMFYVFSKLS